MIGLLEGVVLEVLQDSLLLNVNGVGYEISASNQTLIEMQDLIGKSIKVWIHTHVREDAFQLFGFLLKSEKDFFLQLLKVNGIGPKSALSILSGAPVSLIQDWIEASDAKAISSLPKVGKKTAEQIILTLQGKLVRIDAKSKAVIKLNEAHKKIASALTNLGFKNQIVHQFISTLDSKITVEEGVRSGLQKLTGQSV